MRSPKWRCVQQIPRSHFTRPGEAVSPGRLMTCPAAARTISSSEDQVPQAQHYVARLMMLTDPYNLPPDTRPEQPLTPRELEVLAMIADEATSANAKLLQKVEELRDAMVLARTLHQQSHRRLDHGAGAAVRDPGPRPWGVLSQRELEVLALLAEGVTNAEIGEQLFIAE